MHTYTIRMKQKTIVTKSNLQNLNITLLAVSGIMQASAVFAFLGWLVDGLKYLILILSLLVVFLQYADKRLSIRSSLIISAISAAIAYTCIQTGNFSFLLICLFLITARSTTVDNFVKRSLDVLIILGGGHIIIWLINYIIPLGLPVYTNEAENRIAFGFTHPNICAIKFGWGILMYLWLNWDIMNPKKWAALYIMNTFIYVATKSDSCLIIAGILVLSLLRRFRFLEKAVSAFSYISFPVFGLLNIIGCEMYLAPNRLSRLIIYLDYLFSKRIAMGYLAIRENGMSFLGQPVKMKHEWDAVFNFNGYTIDSAYIYLYVCIGFVYFILVSVGFYKLKKYHSYKVALVILAFSLYALVEVHSIYLTNTFALLLLKYVIFKEKKIE